MNVAIRIKFVVIISFEKVDFSIASPHKSRIHVIGYTLKIEKSILDKKGHFVDFLEEYPDNDPDDVFKLRCETRPFFLLGLHKKTQDFFNIFDDVGDELLDVIAPDE